MGDCLVIVDVIAMWGLYARLRKSLGNSEFWLIEKQTEIKTFRFGNRLR